MAPDETMTISCPAFFKITDYLAEHLCTSYIKSSGVMSKSGSTNFYDNTHSEKPYLSAFEVDFKCNYLENHSYILL
mgnify:CR=1 FL=1